MGRNKLRCQDLWVQGCDRKNHNHKTHLRAGGRGAALCGAWGGRRGPTIGDLTAKPSVRPLVTCQDCLDKFDNPSA